MLIYQNYLVFIKYYGNKRSLFKQIIKLLCHEYKHYSVPTLDNINFRKEVRLNY